MQEEDLVEDKIKSISETLGKMSLALSQIEDENQYLEQNDPMQFLKQESDKINLIMGQQSNRTSRWSSYKNPQLEEILKNQSSLVNIENYQKYTKEDKQLLDQKQSPFEQQLEQLRSKTDLFSSAQKSLRISSISPIDFQQFCNFENVNESQENKEQTISTQDRLDQLNSLQDKLDKKDQVINSLSILQNDLCKSFQDTQIQLESAKKGEEEKLGQLQSKLENLEKLVIDLENQNVQLQNSNIQLQQQIAIQSQENTNREIILKKEFEDQFQSSHHDLNNQNTQLEQKVKQLLHENKLKDNEKTLLQQDIEYYQTTSQKLHESINNLENNVKHMFENKQSILKNNQQEVSQFQLIISQYQKQIHELKGQIQIENIEQNAKSKDLKELKHFQKMSELQIKELKQGNEEKESFIQKIQAEMSGYKQNYFICQKQNMDLNQQIKQIQQSNNENLYKSNFQLNDIEIQHQNRIRKLNGMIEEYKCKEQLKEQEINQYQKEIQYLQNKLQEQNEISVQKLEELVQQLQSKIAIYETQIQTYQNIQKEVQQNQQQTNKFRSNTPQAAKKPLRPQLNNTMQNFVPARCHTPTSLRNVEKYTRGLIIRDRNLQYCWSIYDLSPEYCKSLLQQSFDILQIKEINDFIPKIREALQSFQAIQGVNKFIFKMQNLVMNCTQMKYRPSIKQI